MKKIALFASAMLFVLGVSAYTVSAHQPEYIDSQTVIHIPDPDTSRAYYGELAGAPAVYTISSTQDFSLYLGILSPYLPDARKDFTVTVINAAGATIAKLSVPASEWQKWHEEFAGDTYWKGPEFKQTVPAGIYTVFVSNSDNIGEYVLAPGEAEVFTLAGTPSTIQQIYLVKTRFFGKPWYSVFQGIIGKALLGVIVLLCLITFFLYKRFQKRHKSLPNQER